MPRSRHFPARPGMALIVVMALLAVAGVVLAAVVSLGLAQRRAQRVEIWHMQAEWLAESALERAMARLAADPTYAAETWQIPAEQLGGPDGARVVIRVEPAPAQPGAVLVHAHVQYPDHPEHCARRTRQWLVVLPREVPRS